MTAGDLWTVGKGTRTHVVGRVQVLDGPHGPVRFGVTLCGLTVSRGPYHTRGGRVWTADQRQVVPDDYGVPTCRTCAKIEGDDRD